MNSAFQSKLGVYGLADPVTHRVMYVGQSTDIEFRYRQHCNPFVSDGDRNFSKQEWIGDLRRKGLQPELMVLEECGELKQLDSAERKWIREYKARGEAEFNISIGGRTRAASRILNSPREEWFQFAQKITATRGLLYKIAEDAGRLSSSKNCDAILKLIRRLDREIGAMEKRMIQRFPEWNDVSTALRAKQS